MYLSVNTCWGNISYVKYPVSVSEPCQVTVVDSEVCPPAVVRVVDLAFGREHSLALSAKNEVWAWGSGCQLGLVTNTFPVWRPKKVSLCKAQWISAFEIQSNVNESEWKPLAQSCCGYWNFFTQVREEIRLNVWTVWVWIDGVQVCVIVYFNLVITSLLFPSLAQVEHLAGRHVIQVLSLPDIFIVTFKLQKNTVFCVPKYLLYIFPTGGLWCLP